MSLNYEFGFLAKDNPLFSRELVRPWRLAALFTLLFFVATGHYRIAFSVAESQ